MAKKTLTRDEVLNQLRKHKPELEKRFGVNSLAIFGSLARDEAVGNAKIEVLVDFDGELDWKRFFDVQFFIEDLVEGEVVLVTEKGLREQLRPYIKAESIYV